MDASACVTTALDRTAQKKFRRGFLSLFPNHFYYFIAAEKCLLNRSVKNTRVHEHVWGILNGIFDTLAYVLVGHRINTFDTKLMMVMIVMKILTIMTATSRDSRVLHSYRNDANFSNSTPGMEKFVDFVCVLFGEPFHFFKKLQRVLYS